MQKRELISYYRTLVGGLRKPTPEQAKLHVQGVLNTIAFSLSFGENVGIGDFGTFKLVTTKDGTKTVEFTPCKALRVKINAMDRQFKRLKEENNNSSKQ